jgi:hypothetical protein
MQQTSITTDFLVIGSGVIGINIARGLKKRDTTTKVMLTGKETSCGLHASGETVEYSTRWQPTPAPERSDLDKSTDCHSGLVKLNIRIECTRQAMILFHEGTGWALV